MENITDRQIIETLGEHELTKLKSLPPVYKNFDKEYVYYSSLIDINHPNSDWLFSIWKFDCKSFYLAENLDDLDLSSPTYYLD